MLTIQLIVLLIVLVILKAFIKSDRLSVSIIISLLLAVVFVIQLSSVIVTGNIADYRFYENFDIGDVLSVLSFFSSEGVIIAFSLLLTTFIIYYFGKQLTYRIKQRKIFLLVLILGLVILSLKGGIINNAYATVRLKLTSEASFDQALAYLDIDKEKYVRSSDIKAVKGKNIIVLSLESLEKGYLEDNMNFLTPNLTQLAQENSLFNMKQSPGSGWTSGSMYTAVTGVPAFFGIHGNSVFQKSYSNKLTSVADVLIKAGYDVQWFLGKKEYSGIDDMLSSLGFKVKSEKDFETKYDKVDWGIQDKDLFEEFKKEILVKKSSDTPFAFFLSTISTHFPDGVPDKRMDSLLPPQRSRLELMVSATDYLIGELISFLNEEGLMENTVFYIYPDHLLMGKNSEVLDDFKERSLYLITNAERRFLDYDVNQDIYQIDIPKIIIQGAEIKHNALFLTDFINSEDKNAFVQENDQNLLRLNEASLKTLNCKDGFAINFDEESNEFEIRNNDDINMLTDKIPLSGKICRILYDVNLRPYDSYLLDITQVLDDPNAFAYLDIYSINGQFYTSLKGRYHFGITKRGKSDILFKKSELDFLEEGHFLQENQIEVKIQSNSWNAKKPSSFNIKGNNTQISRGMTVIHFQSSEDFEFRTFDTHASIDEARAFVEVLNQMLIDQSKFIILAHDSAFKSLKPFLADAGRLGFIELSNLRDRQAYVANNLKGDITEYKDNTSIEVNIFLPSEIQSNSVYFNSPKIEFENRNDRYIAHAGGMIDNRKYTNSKEALDLSYEKGFRIFELDIIQTSDGAFVAAHDWPNWVKQTGYKGNTPVSRNEFLKHKLYGKYTPLDMDSINQWFKDHADAILVTDKVDSPLKFSSEFKFKDRLRMELFSLHAIVEASQNGITALVSERPLSLIKGDVIPFFQKHKLEYVTMSRRNIQRDKKLLETFREHNIKVFVYHVNFDPGKDEEYVLNNEIGEVYGMYADKWISSFEPLAD